MADIVTYNPYYELKISSYRFNNDESIRQTIQNMQAAYSLWRIKPPEARISYIESLVDILLTQKDALARLIATEMGKPISQARKEIDKCINMCEYYMDITTEVLVDESLDQYQLTYQPTGVIFGVMPWNYPFWQVFRFLIPTILSGNVCLIKHSENVTGCALAIKDLMKFTGLTDHIVEVVCCSNQQVHDIIRNPLVKGISLTGGKEAGIAVAKTAAEVLKPCILELGGNDGYYIHDDIKDIESVCKTLCEARLENSGQSCISPKRFIINKNIYKEFRETILTQLAKTKVGNPLEEATQVGPIAREDLVKKLHQQIKKLEKLGAKIAFQGEIPKEGYFFPVTVLEIPGNINLDEEIFGPVFCLYETKDQESAIKLINQSGYGLGAGIFMDDIGEAENIARLNIDTGMCGINRCVRSTPEMPFGGVKDSGYGRELGVSGLINFCNIKVIMHEE